LRFGRIDKPPTFFGRVHDSGPNLLENSVESEGVLPSVQKYLHRRSRRS
jgi:hypothetical protein